MARKPAQKRTTRKASSSARFRTTNLREPGETPADDFSSEDYPEDDFEPAQFVPQSRSRPRTDLYYKTGGVDGELQHVNMRLPTVIVEAIDLAAAAMAANGVPTNRSKLIARLLEAYLPLLQVIGTKLPVQR